MNACPFAVVLYASNVEATRQFYEALGFAFTKENHPGCPPHWGHDLGLIMLEIYPLREGAKVSPGTSIVIVAMIDDFAVTATRLLELGCRIQAPEPGPNGRRAVTVKDPDGRLVRIAERDPTAVQ